MNKEVNLTKRILTQNGLRYVPVVLSPNGRIKPHMVLVQGQPEHHPEGAYYLEWRDGSRRVRVSVGNDPMDAATHRMRKEAELNARNLGVEIAPSNGHQPGQGKTLSQAVDDYLDEIKVTKKDTSHYVYALALRYFKDSCGDKQLKDVTRSDLISYIAFLRDRHKFAANTVRARFANVVIFLKASGVRGLVSKRDWPRVVEEEPDVYEREEIDMLLAASNPEKRLWWEFFLMTGMREQEVVYSTWADVNFTHSTVSVKYKREYGFDPKNYREREIPIPTKLSTALKARKDKAKAKAVDLIFPTSNNKPRVKAFLDDLKECATKAELDPKEFWLHKFRATFATWNLWSGVDLRTVQMWLGHRDLKSTMRYLKPARSKEARAKVNETFA